MSAIFPRDAVVRRYLNTGARPGTSRKVVIGAFLGGVVCAFVVAGLPVSTLSGGAPPSGAQADTKRVADSDCKEHPWMSARCADVPQRTAAPVTVAATPVPATAVAPTPVAPSAPAVVTATAPKVVAATAPTPVALAPVASAPVAPMPPPRPVAENPAPPPVSPVAENLIPPPGATPQAMGQGPIPASMAAMASAPPADPPTAAPTTATSPAASEQAAHKLAAKKAAHKAAMARLRAEKRIRAARLQEQQREDYQAAATRYADAPRGGGWFYPRAPRPPADVGYGGYGGDLARRYYRPAPDDFD